MTRTRHKAVSFLKAATLLCVAVFFTAAFSTGGEQTAQDGLNAASSIYYQEMRGYCKQNACCLSSVDVMEKNGYVPAPQAGCPAGSEQYRLTCDGGMPWCVIKDSRVFDNPAGKKGQ